ncbi:MAG: hypothetical protein IT175_18245 [Acidobacteria bacterium]|nr:hypothetical protein [Acidobacteriota bacterium]
MKSKLTLGSRQVRLAAFVALAFVALGIGGCFAGTVPVPIQPGAEQLPAGNLKAREDLAIFQLAMLKKAEDAHFAMHGTFGTVQELMEDGTMNTPLQGGRSYTIDVKVLDGGGRYEALAVPVEYGPTGRRSFYMDETGVIRGADHEGGAPKATDPVVPLPM